MFMIICDRKVGESGTEIMGVNVRLEGWARATLICFTRTYKHRKAAEKRLEIAREALKAYDGWCSNPRIIDVDAAIAAFENKE